MGKITESVLLGEKKLKIWYFHFLVYIKQNEGSIVYKCMCDVRVRVLLRFFIKRTVGLLIGPWSWEPFTTFYCFALSVIYTLECSCSSCKTVVKLFTQR